MKLGKVVGTVVSTIKAPIFDQRALLLRRMRRAEIEHTPIARLSRRAQRMAEISPRQPDRQRGVGQGRAQQLRRAQHTVLLLRMLQDQHGDSVVHRMCFRHWRVI